jgi:hypothetical protein
MSFEEFKEAVADYLGLSLEDISFHQSQYNRCGMQSRVGSWAAHFYGMGGFILEYQYDTGESYVDCNGCEVLDSLEEALTRINEVLFAG